MGRNWWIVEAPFVPPVTRAKTASGIKCWASSGSIVVENVLPVMWGSTANSTPVKRASIAGVRPALIAVNCVAMAF